LVERGTQEHPDSEEHPVAKTDVKSLSSMLAARWKAGAVAETSKPQELRAGQIRSFRMKTLDPASKKIELELV
jgi:small subunit ribosomal protein S1